MNCRAYLGGASKLSALQDSYAAAMQSLGLERGIKGSKAHHQTVKAFYRAIEQAERQSLPEPTLKTEKWLFGANKTVREPVEEYYQRANSVFKQQNLQLVGLKEQLRKEKDQSRTKDVRQNRELRELRQEKQKSGHYKAKAEAWDRLNKGLNNLPDEKYAQNLKTELQDILEAQEIRESSHMINLELGR